MLGLAGNLILFVQNGLSLAVVQLEGGVDLAAALDGLFVELVSTALLPVESGLEAVTHMEEKVDGADGVGVGGDAFAIASGLKVDDGRSGGKHTPVNGVGECLLLRKTETGAGRSELRRLLTVSHYGLSSQDKGAKSECGVHARLQRRVWLLVD